MKQWIFTRGSWRKSICLMCVSVCVFEIGSYSVAHTGLKLAIFLPQSPDYWGYRHEPPYLALLFFFFFFLFCGWYWGSHLLGRHSTAWATQPALFCAG
jgi:hypothetical protein